MPDHAACDCAHYIVRDLTMFYYAMPRMKGIERYDARWGTVGFWIMCLAMVGIGLAFGVAGVLQAYIERVMRLGFMTAQTYMRFWFVIVFSFGIAFLVRQWTMIIHLFTIKPAKPEVAAA
jgi:nitric oxide reductase subunit B